MKRENNIECPCGSGNDFELCCGKNGNVVLLSDYKNSRSNNKNLSYQIKVTIKGSKPPIWRRLLVPSGITFDHLHYILQIAFDWMNMHLYSFECGNNIYSPADEDDVFLTPSEAMPTDLMEHLKQFMPFLNNDNELDSCEVTIDESFNTLKKCTYTYDFGDNWDHEIVIEKIISEKIDIPVCLTGRKNSPEEDVGGIYGHYHFLELLQNESKFTKKERMEYKDELDYARDMYEDYDADYFSVEEINEMLKTFDYDEPATLYGDDEDDDYEY